MDNSLTKLARATSRMGMQIDSVPTWSECFDKAPKVPPLPICSACATGYHDEPDTTELKGDCNCPCHH